MHNGRNVSTMTRTKPPISMLPSAPPSTGTETLFDYYAALLGGAAPPERGDHAVF